MKISPSVNVVTAISNKSENELFRMMLAWMYFFCPRRMANSVLPPTPIIMDIAMMKSVIGKQSVIPAMPRLPTPWPT